MAYWYPLLLILLSVCVQSSNGDTLKVVNVLYRHGDRSPLIHLPDDPVNETFWPYGYGKLTDIGKEQHYHLGKLFRKRYDKLLTAMFDDREIYIRSSDFDRCLISAYSNLAGLYSNSTEEDDLKLPFMTWQPASVHTIPTDLDKLLSMDKPCVKVEESVQKLLSSPDVQKLSKDYEQLFHFLRLKTGLNLTENEVFGAGLIFDALFCESQHGWPLPDYTQLSNFTCNNNQIIPCHNRTVWQILKALTDYKFFLLYESDVIHKFDGGPLLTEMVNNFHDFVQDKRSQKFNMYSGHDSTVTAVLSALRVFDRKAPQYTATVIIELHSVPGKAEEHEVKVFYKNVTDVDDMHLMHLPDCPSPCYLKRFSEFVDQYKITDWDVECGNKGDNALEAGSRTGPKQEDIILISIFGTAGVMLVVGVIIYAIKRQWPQRKYDAMP